jgi:hypothetical protein
MNSLPDANYEQQHRLQPHQQQPQPDPDPDDSRIVPKIGECEVSMVRRQGMLNNTSLYPFPKLDG